VDFTKMTDGQLFGELRRARRRREEARLDHEATTFSATIAIELPVLCGLALDEFSELVGRRVQAIRVQYAMQRDIALIEQEISIRRMALGAELSKSILRACVLAGESVEDSVGFACALSDAIVWPEW